MTIYIAFLRGINVGGHKLIPMRDLVELFEGLGFSDVATYIQSGNVLFRSSAKNASSLVKKIEAGLRQGFGSDIAVFIRTVDELSALVARQPFHRRKLGAQAKAYVTMIQKPLGTAPTLPFWTKKAGVEVIEIVGCDLLCIAHQVGSKFGYPNAFVENEFAVAATTRGWNTIEKVIQLGQAKLKPR